MQKSALWLWGKSTVVRVKTNTLRFLACRRNNKENSIPRTESANAWMREVTEKARKTTENTWKFKSLEGWNKEITLFNLDFQKALWFEIDCKRKGNSRGTSSLAFAGSGGMETEKCRKDYHPYLLNLPLTFNTWFDHLHTCQIHNLLLILFCLLLSWLTSSSVF